METLAVSGQEAGKKAKVAAIAAPATPNPKTSSRVEIRVSVGSAKADRTQTPQAKAPCRGWTMDAGCKFGKNFSPGGSPWQVLDVRVEELTQKAECKEFGGAL